MSRSWRRISFSRRSRFSSAVTSPSAAEGSTAYRSRLRPIQRTSVDRPIPRSPAISRCVRPLVCTRRRASSANSFVNRRCCVIEFLIAHRELSTFPRQVHIWADRFDGSLDDVFDLQDQVAISVAGVIEPTLQAAEVRRSAARPTDDLNAYDLYLRALPDAESGERERTTRALGLLYRAIERDQSYGPALALAARCHDILYVSGWSDNLEASRRESVSLAQRALHAAPDDPDTLARSAYALGMSGEDLDAAIALMDRSLQLKSGLCPRLAFEWLAETMGWASRSCNRASRKGTTSEFLATPTRRL